MEIISAFFKGILYSFSLLSPVSFSGHESLFRFTDMNLSKGGYDCILPLVTYFAAIIGLCYFLRKDLKKVFSTIGFLLKNIKTKKIDLNTKDPDESFLNMLLFGSVVLLLSPLTALLFKGMSGNLPVTAFGFLISALFIYMAQNVKEKTLKESNHTILGGCMVALFNLFGGIPGVSSIGAMYFAGSLTGFKRDFSIKYAYFLTLIWLFSGFIKYLVMVFLGLGNPHYGVVYYIFSFLGALGAGFGAGYLMSLAQKERKIWYYAIYNVVIAIIVFVIWIRG